MRSPIAERALALSLLALSSAPLACRDDKPIPVENLGTGGSKATGGAKGSGGAKGTGGSGSGGSSSTDTAAPVETGSDDGLVAVDAGDGGLDGGEVGDVAVGEVGDTGPVTEARPFYMRPAYPATTAVVSGEQAKNDDAVGAFYNSWATRYVKDRCGGKIVETVDEGANVQTISNRHGAGMVATVIMAGHAANAKANFDGMLTVARNYRATGATALMSATVEKMGANGCLAEGGQSVEGDANIAYALLLADKQWGSGGARNYLEEAKKTIAEIKARQFHPTLKLPTNGTTATTVRSANLLPGHFQAFFNATQDPFWNEAVAAVYALVAKIQAGPAAASGLLPDIINVANPEAPTPGAGVTGRFKYDAVRAPLYFALDHVANSSRAQAKTALDKINGWIMPKTMSMPTAVRDDYQLDGDVEPGAAVGESLLFESAFGAAATVDKANQAWVDALFARIIRTNPAPLKIDSNAETGQLIAMILMSGHWWAP